jgi:hypothetical protein
MEYDNFPNQLQGSADCETKDCANALAKFRGETAQHAGRNDQAVGVKARRL